MKEHSMGPSGSGTVVLDLDAGTGVLILYTDVVREHEEIEVYGPVVTHSMVRRRDVAGAHPLYAAVYPSLPYGSYTVGDGLTSVNIVEGQVTTAHVYDGE
jgi:hypothetical protein